MQFDLATPQPVTLHVAWGQTAPPKKNWPQILTHKRRVLISSVTSGLPALQEPFLQAHDPRGQQPVRVIGTELGRPLLTTGH